MLIKSLFLHVFCFFRILIMSRRFALTDYEKGRIDELKRVNNNNRQIAAELGCSHICIGSYFNSPSTYGPAKRSERPPVLNKLDKRHIYRSIGKQQYNQQRRKRRSVRQQSERPSQLPSS